MNSAIVFGGFWVLFGLGMLITGSASIERIPLSKRHARMPGAATMVFGLTLVSSGVLTEMGWSVSRKMALSTFFVFFVAVNVLFVTIAAVRLLRWTRAGEEAGEGRRRALIAGSVFVVQFAFLIFVGVIVTTL